LLTGLETTPLIEAAEYLKSSVRWDRYFRLVSLIGDSLNSHKDRFDKSDLLEHSIQIFSGGQVKWIDDLGADHLLPTGERMEMKYVLGCLHGKNRNTKKTIASIKLMNSLGTCTHTTLPKNYADYLLLSDSSIVCLLDKATLSRYVVCRGDGLYAERIPVSQCFIISKASSALVVVDSPFDYAEQKRQMQKKFIEQVI
jgi:hypothetical protein